MNELDVMKHAKTYLDSFSAGKDPLTGEALPGGDSLNNPRYRKCFGYVAGILQQVIDNGGAVGKPAPAPLQQLTRQEAAAYRPSEQPMTVSKFLEEVAEQTGKETVAKISGARLTQELEKMGFLLSEADENGGKGRRPTAAGKKIGISTQIASGKNGTFTAVLYDASARKFLTDNLLTVR